jgi:hypothetical protein
VGDGVINVFDISVVLSYIFKDPGYDSLPANPALILTTEARSGDAAAACEQGLSRSAYLADYAADVCAGAGSAGARQRRLRAADGRLATPRPRRLLEGPFATVDQALAAAAAARNPLATRNPGLQVRSPGATIVAHVSSGADRFEYVPALQYDVVLAAVHASGTWITVHMGGVATRLELAFSGITGNGALDNLRFDHEPPADPDSIRIRFTRLCEYAGSCDRRCAGIEAGVATSAGVLQGNTVSLVQRPPESACAYDLHAWVPAGASAQAALGTGRRLTSACIGVDYIALSNGDAGLIGTTSMCARSVSPPP